MSHRKPCGKITYKTRRAVLRVLERLPADSVHREARAYFCRSCSGWHLTSKV